METYPLYDVPWLVRDPNEFRMSEKRHEIEVRNQAVVDDYFVARARGSTHQQARIETAKKNKITTKEVEHCRIWFYQEAKRRKKYDFLQKFPF
jgi:hypothetical protein